MATKEYFDRKSTSNATKSLITIFPFYCASAPFSPTKRLIFHLKFLVFSINWTSLHKDHKMAQIIFRTCIIQRVCHSLWLLPFLKYAGSRDNGSANFWLLQHTVSIMAHNFIYTSPFLSFHKARKILDRAHWVLELKTWCYINIS